MCVCVFAWKVQLGDCDLLVMTERRRQGGREVRIDEARVKQAERGRALSPSASFSLCDSGSQLSFPLLLSSAAAQGAGRREERKKRLDGKVRGR